MKWQTEESSNEMIKWRKGKWNDLCKEIMMLYKNTKAIVNSLNGDTDFFDIVTGILLGDILTHICLYST